MLDYQFKIRSGGEYYIITYARQLNRKAFWQKKVNRFYKNYRLVGVEYLNIRKHKLSVGNFGIWAVKKSGSLI